MKNKVIKENLPELICIRKPNKNCNDGFYELRIPYSCIPRSVYFVGMYQVYQFIGLKYLTTTKGK